MTPTQHAAFEAICRADPECRCPLISGEAPYWYCPQTEGYIPNAIAAAAITDHLHTRLESEDFRESEVVRQGGVWRVLSLLDKEIGAFPSKLSAYLCAHAVRLGLAETVEALKADQQGGTNDPA